MIELTVGLPMYRAKYCGWIALEGLIRQRNVDFEWELIVAEEQDDETFGEENIFKYEDDLKKAGCVRILYKPFEEWSYLSNKIKYIVRKSHSDSVIYASNAADVFSPPLRLKTQYDLFKNRKKIDYTSSGRTIVYNIETEQTYLNDGKIREKLGMNISDGSCKTVRMELMKTLPKRANLKKSVDGWIFNHLKWQCKQLNKKFYVHTDLETDNWKYGMNIHGMNNLTISGVREKRFQGDRPEFVVDCPIDINETIPKSVLKRLKETKKYLHLHTQGLDTLGVKNNE
jgi:hypothetical protein